MNKHPLGLRHVALLVQNLAACVDFYTQLLDMKIEWQPDAENVYLTSGTDNLALHQAPKDFIPHSHQHLDHIGFCVRTPEAVDAWYQKLCEQNVPIKAEIKNHRDGARSFYCCDPDNNVIQIIYHPPIASTLL